MSTSKLCILFGGTFDPVHNGHIRIAKALYQLVKPAKVQLLPNYLCADDKTQSATIEQRLDMLSLAIKDLPFIEINYTEIERQGRSYTYDTLSILRRHHPETPLAFACGSDTFLDMQFWDKANDMFELAHFIVVDRPNYLIEQSDWATNILEHKGTTNPQHCHQLLKTNILTLDLPPMQISSTDIRHSCENKMPIKNKVPPCVQRYIQQQRLYGSQ